MPVAPQWLCLGLGASLLLASGVPTADAQTTTEPQTNTEPQTTEPPSIEELLALPSIGVAQTVDELRWAVEESVDGGDYDLAIEQLALLIAQLEDPDERADYVQYREELIATHAELSDFERLHLRMSGAGRQLATLQLGGEAEYEAAIAGGIATGNTAPLIETCRAELEHRMGFRHPLRLTSQPWAIAIDEGVYNISGVISGPEWGRFTGRWRYHCLVHHSDRGIQVLRAETW